MFKFNLKYFIIFIFIFIIEVIIALFIRDKFISPYFGDFLVIFLVYYFVLSFIDGNKTKIAIGVLLFAFVIEVIQYFQILHYFNLHKFKFARILAGTIFLFEKIII